MWTSERWPNPVLTPYAVAPERRARSTIARERIMARFADGASRGAAPERATAPTSSIVNVRPSTETAANAPPRGRIVLYCVIVIAPEGLVPRGRTLAGQPRASHPRTERF